MDSSYKKIYNESVTIEDDCYYVEEDDDYEEEE